MGTERLGNIRLRRFKPEDSAVILSWISDEKVFYEWSAGRLGSYPPADNALSVYHAKEKNDKTYEPLCLIADDGSLLGHILIRCPDKKRAEKLRFGFIIVDAEKRGEGLGRALLEEALFYLKGRGNVKSVSIGVFEQNTAAVRCYEKTGFLPVGISEAYELPQGVWNCLELEKGLANEGSGFRRNVLQAFRAEKLTDVRTMPPLVLAHVGDAVYELIIRTFISQTHDMQVQKVHKKCTALVNNHTQSELLRHIEGLLDEEEAAVCRRARNTRSYTVPKNAVVHEYRSSTGFEALCGWLYLNDKTGRLIQLAAYGLRGLGKI